jgi:hypothetical protein
MKAIALAMVCVGCFSLASCDWCPPSCCTDVDVAVTLWVRDSAGRSMLDETTPGFFHEDSIRLYTLRDGILTERYNSMLDAPRGFSINDKAKGYISFAPELEPKFPQTPTAVIKWSANDSDTVQFEVVRKCSNTRLKRAWFNGELSYERLIEVTK